MKTDEELIVELRALRESIDRLYEAIVKDSDETEGMIEASTFTWMDFDISHRVRANLARCGIASFEQLTSHTRAELSSYKRLTSEMIRKIVIAMGSLGMHLRGEKVYDVQDEIVESIDIEEDNRIITGLLDELGYERFDLADDGQRWAFEAIRFSMNNPKLAMQFKTYLWPQFVDKENFTVKEVAQAVGDAVKAMKPLWKSLVLDGEDTQEALNLDELRKKVFETESGYISNNANYTVELRAIGVYARKLRRFEAMEKKRIREA